jgi:hypothetical protein
MRSMERHVQNAIRGDGNEAADADADRGSSFEIESHDIATPREAYRLRRPERSCDQLIKLPRRCHHTQRASV